MTTATVAKTELPEPGWGESKAKRPTFVQYGEEILPPPYLEGHYPWWVSRTEAWTRWTYKVGPSAKNPDATPRQKRVSTRSPQKGESKAAWEARTERANR